MSLEDLPHLVRSLVPAVLEAARVEMGYFRQGAEVERKKDDSPVTAADREAETILVKAIGLAAPGVPVVAEESAAAGLVPDIGREFFLVDPLDGTKEFIAGRDEFTINIGLVRDGRPVLGIIYAPARAHLLFSPWNGGAAEAFLPPETVAPDLEALARPIRTRVPDPASLVGLQSRSHRPDGEALYEKLAVAECRRLGSSIKFGLIARGEADLYARLGPTCQWDTAAGHAILSAAGGRVTTLDGGELTYGHTSAKFINPHFVAWARNPLI